MEPGQWHLKLINIKIKNTKGDNYDFTFYLEFSTTSNHTF